MKKKSLLIMCLILVLTVAILVLNFVTRKENKKEDNKEKVLTYEQIKTIIEKKGYSFERDDTDSTNIINLISDVNKFSFYLKEGKLVYIAFSNMTYDDEVVLAYSFESDILLGVSRDEKLCRYTLTDSGEDKNEVLNGYECSDSEIEHIKFIKEDYDRTIKETFKLTKEELNNFIIEYNNKTK